MQLTQIKGNNSYEYNNYKILGKSNKKKFSFMCIGKCIETSNKVIIKRLNPIFINDNDAKQRFITEGRLEIKHSNLQIIIEAFEYENNFYIILEYIEGIDLKHFLRKNRKLFKKDFSLTKTIINDVILGLNYLHSNNYIHADIKPSNIIISHSENGYKATLIDYGETRESNKRLYSKNISFSYLYSSPEQVLKANTLVNNTSDIYSLGLTLYEMLTFEYPFNNCSPIKLVLLQLNMNIKPHSKLSPDIYKIIRIATAKYVFPKPMKFYSKSEIFLMLIKGQKRRYKNIAEFKTAILELY